MTPQQILILTHIVFIWVVILHTFEEVACGIMDLQLEHFKVTQKRYLAGAGAIATLNLGTLALLVLGVPAGYYLGLFTSALIGILQAVVHTVGYVREKGKARGLGAGFYSSIPLAVIGAVVFVQIIRILPG